MRFHPSLLLALLPGFAMAAADHPWQVLSDPTAAAAAAVFPSPPPEYSAQFTWGWSGPVDAQVIARDLDTMQKLGVQAAIIEPGGRMKDPYLSPGFFDLVRVAVEEAKKRNMRLWIMDEGGYPSGFAGGKFSTDRPDLRMEALAAERIPVAGGQTYTQTVGSDVICALAVNLDTQETKVLDTPNGQLSWTAPTGNYEIVLPRWVYRSGPTRSANNATGAKDYTHSLMDFLNPAADALFAQWTFDAYQKAIGDEFGKTVLGFRGDEPAFNFNPWTPALLAEFQQRKGYDLRPYLAAIAYPQLRRTEAQRRAYADYWDVWSDLFRDGFYNMEAQWCADHGLEMQLHIEHEEILPQLALADGDFFKCFRNIQMPGIDTIWHQIWMDNPADFPKLASSAAHLFGKPHAMCEAFAAYQPPPNVVQARWILNHLMARGINHIEYMFFPASTPRGAFGGRGGAAPGAGNGPAPNASAFANTGSPTTAPSATGATVTSNPSGANTTTASAATSAGVGGNLSAGTRPNGARRGGRGNFYYREPTFPALAAYVNRACYLLGEGRPAAQIGLYIPSSSFWFGDRDLDASVNTHLLDIAHQLMQNQRDFDFVDEQALSSVLQLQGNQLVNLSGQGYRAIIVPPAAAISQAGLDHLRAFAAAGGKVIFLGPPPPLVVGKTFLEATGPADISWAVHQDDPSISPAVLAALPAPDLALDQPAPLVNYTHRRLRDADVYFIFNSGEDKVTRIFTLAGSGDAQVWDANTGLIAPVSGATTGDPGTLRVPLELGPEDATIIVLTHAAPATVAAE